MAEQWNLCPLSVQYIEMLRYYDVVLVKLGRHIDSKREPCPKIELIWNSTYPLDVRMANINFKREHRN